MAADATTLHAGHTPDRRRVIDLPRLPEADEEVVPCDLCGSEDARLLYVIGDFRLHVDEREWGVVQCRHCGLGWLAPRPRAHVMKRYYPASYYAERGEKHARARFAAQSEYVGPFRGRLLDVGCARGEFLRYMRSRGWDVVGLEAHAEDLPKDIPIGRGWDAPELASGDFDAITAWSVFEHLHHPLGSFQRARDLLRAGGRLVLHVPNLASPRSRLAWQEDVPRHLYFFSAGTLDRYAKRAGLTLVKVHHDTRIMDGSGGNFIRLHLARAAGKSGTEYLRWASIPSRAERRRAWPAGHFALAPFGIVERIATAPVVRRRLKLNGYIVAVFVR
jgi:2-polyprenyl-3-methyl-5-hydroxy-6-metoxy-1,4-benzoquinol methylase